jgi:hypothetical protein
MSEKQDGSKKTQYFGGRLLFVATLKGQVTEIRQADALLSPEETSQHRRNPPFLAKDNNS